MTLRRGFKSDAESIAREIRGELLLTSAAPLDVFRLADHLAIPILPMSRLAAAVPDSVRHFNDSGRSAFSAVTVFLGTFRIVVHNDSHSTGRQASNIAHELAHALLLHPPAPALDDDKNRNWDPQIEEEANWLAGTLLVPEEAALLIVRNQWSDLHAASVFGVSEDMVRYRVQVTGARLRVLRSGGFSSRR